MHDEVGFVVIARVVPGRCAGALYLGVVLGTVPWRDAVGERPEPSSNDRHYSRSGEAWLNAPKRCAEASLRATYFVTLRGLYTSKGLFPVAFAPELSVGQVAFLQNAGLLNEIHGLILSET